MTTSLQLHVMFSISSSMVEGVLRLVQLGFEGAHRNWFGWGCPAQCFQPGISHLLLAFLAGATYGILRAGFILWTLWTWVSPSVPRVLLFTFRWGPVILHLLVTCMSIHRQDGDTIELSCTVDGLRVTIAGPQDQATARLRKIREADLQPSSSHGITRILL